MKWLYPDVLAFGLALAAGGCSERSPVVADKTVNDPFSPVLAQARLPTVKLFVDQHVLTAEIARAPAEIVTGMMFRTNLPPTECMLFVFPDAERRAFWMKNCVVPLSAAYVDPEGVIREIHDLQPGDTNSIPTESRQIQYVIETNQGWFKERGLKPGTRVRTSQGTLRETFFPYQAPPGRR